MRMRMYVGSYSRDECVSIRSFFANPLPLYNLIYDFLLPTNFNPQPSSSHIDIYDIMCMYSSRMHVLATQNVDELHLYKRNFTADNKRRGANGNTTKTIH